MANEAFEYEKMNKFLTKVVQETLVKAEQKVEAEFLANIEKVKADNMPICIALSSILAQGTKLEKFLKIIHRREFLAKDKNFNRVLFAWNSGDKDYKLSYGIAGETGGGLQLVLNVADVAKDIQSLADSQPTDSITVKPNNQGEEQTLKSGKYVFSKMRRFGDMDAAKETAESGIAIDGREVDMEHFTKIFLPEDDPIRDFQMPFLEGEINVEYSLLVFLHKSGLFQLEDDADESMVITGKVVKAFATSVGEEDFSEEKFAKDRIEARRYSAGGNGDAVTIAL